MGTVTVLLFHTVVSTNRSPMGPDQSPTRPVHTVVQLAQGWRYSYGWRPAPPLFTYCGPYGCAARSNGEPPWRPISLALSAGLAFASAPDATTGAGAGYGIRLGANLVDRLSLTVGIEGANLRNGGSESEFATLLGLQWFPLPILYFRGAVGAGAISAADSQVQTQYFGTGTSNGIYQAWSAALGLELGQTADFSIGIEGTSTWLFLPAAVWNSVQFNVVLSFF